MKPLLTFLALLSVFTISTLGNASLAQMNSKPFSFSTPGGGLGMSIGGKQAILNNEISGAAPGNMLRADDGSLLSVVKGKGGVPVVSYEGGSVIPSFRGGSFRGDNESWSIGVFNTFFEARKNDSLTSTYAQMQTGAVISTWTGRIASNLPVSYTPANSVDTWTGMVMQASY